MISNPPEKEFAPIVSVLVPVRNAGAFIYQGLQSLIRQSWCELEIIVIDDGSTDQTPEIVRDVASKDPRIKSIQTEARGIVSALEIARAHARGTWLARFDGDDIAHPRRIEDQVRYLQSVPRPTAVGCRVCCFPSSQVGEGLRHYTRWLNETLGKDEIDRNLFVENPISHPTMMMHREDLERVGGWRDVPWPEDYDLVLRLAQSGVRFEKLSAYRHALREHASRLTWNDPRYSKDSFLRCKAHYLAKGPLARVKNFAVWGSGRTGKWLVRALEEEGRCPDLFIDIDPRKVGGKCRDVPVISPEALKSSEVDFILGAVASRGARDIVRERLIREFHRIEVADFIMCA